MHFVRFLLGLCNGRVTTVPIHSNKDLARGLVRKIIREDLDMSLDDFMIEWKKFSK